MSLSKPCPENTKIENMYHALKSACTPAGGNIVSCIFFYVHTMVTLLPTLTAAAEGSHEAAVLVLGCLIWSDVVVSTFGTS